MDALKGKLLTKYKQLKNIDGTELDGIFSFAIETAIYEILSYCHIRVDEWSEALDNTAVLIASDLVAESKAMASAGDGVKSLTEGDFTIVKESQVEALVKLTAGKSFTRNYYRVLNRYRKLAR